MSLVLTGLAFFGLTGCTGTDSKNENNAAGKDVAESGQFRGDYPINVVATVGMVADVVRNVGGEHVTVTQIMGSGVDPHLYKATRDDVQSLITADVIFYNGLMLEGKMTDTLVKVARNKPVAAVTEELGEDQLLEPEDFAGHYDPHVWMDVSAWSLAVEKVAATLSSFDPTHAETYQQNAAAYREELRKLNEFGKTAVGSIPATQRVLITSHDAFNYFGRAYGLEVLGVQGLSTESEAGLRQINSLVDTIVSRKISAVFVESSVSSKNIEALVEGVRDRGGSVRIGGELFSDAMGQDGTYEGTYIGMLDHNITLVTQALGGSVEKGGLNGKLKQSSMDPSNSAGAVE